MIIECLTIPITILTHGLKTMSVRNRPTMQFTGPKRSEERNRMKIKSDKDKDREDRKSKIEEEMMTEDSVKTKINKDKIRKILIKDKIRHHQ